LREGEVELEDAHGLSAVRDVSRITRGSNTVRERGEVLLGIPEECAKDRVVILIGEDVAKLLLPRIPATLRLRYSSTARWTEVPALEIRGLIMGVNGRPGVAEVLRGIGMLGDLVCRLVIVIRQVQ
jgi:hypothetical protein